jgi:hypothetical protein
MNRDLSDAFREKFNDVIKVDYYSLSKKTDKFRLNVDVKKVNTYQDLKDFMENYSDYLSFLGKTQIELILKEIDWNTSIYTILAANKFKKGLKSNTLKVWN